MDNSDLIKKIYEIINASKIQQWLQITQLLLEDKIEFFENKEGRGAAAARWKLILEQLKDFMRVYNNE